jgi:hypothetical protein
MAFLYPFFMFRFKFLICSSFWFTNINRVCAVAVVVYALI